MNPRAALVGHAPFRDGRTAIPIPARAVPILLAALLASCRPPAPGAWQGYVEADYVRVASPLGGTLLECPVQRGSQVRAGDPLFRLESEAERAAVEEARRRRDQAAARLENLRKGRRPAELDIIAARVAQVGADLALAESELSRRERLLRDGAGTPAEADLARARRDALRATLEGAEAEMATARLGGRDDEVRAGEADLAAADAALARAGWALDRKSMAAPADAVVHDTLFRPGEFVPAGQPVVSLLPPANLHVRFFVPEPEAAGLALGGEVEVHVDGRSVPLRGTVRHRATQPEFTPPVIYSREARSRLVFRFEAALASEAVVSLAPGQPVDVRSAVPAAAMRP